MYDIEFTLRFRCENKFSVRYIERFLFACEIKDVAKQVDIWGGFAIGLVRRSFRETRSTQDCASNQPDFATCLTLKAPVAATQRERGHAKVYRYISWAHARSRTTFLSTSGPGQPTDKLMPTYAVNRNSCQTPETETCVGKCRLREILRYNGNTWPTLRIFSPIFVFSNLFQIFFLFVNYLKYEGIL